MSVITLTSDYGIKDHYAGSIKGALFSELINPNIVDISHQISPFNIVEAAYIIENSYKNFPENSIHIIGVDSEKTPEQNQTGRVRPSEILLRMNNYCCLHLRKWIHHTMPDTCVS